jgi:hypothetical protein
MAAADCVQGENSVAGLNKRPYQRESGRNKRYNANEQRERRADFVYEN